MESDDHGKVIDETYLDYARNDPQCTWELSVKLRDLYKRHNLKKRITHIYSEASTGKGYYEELGVQSFFLYDHRLKANTRNLAFDLKNIGVAMEGYYGGRSEARIRHLIMECMHAVFRAQYPSTNALMRLQDLLSALEVIVDRGVDTPAKRFLETAEVKDFQRKDTWLKLRGFAHIRPGDNILPFRCEYETDDEELTSINVGINLVRSACDGWYSFAAICSSKFLTGKCPEILETIEFIPVGRQETKSSKFLAIQTTRST